MRKSKLARRKLRHEFLETRRLLFAGTSFVDANDDSFFNAADGDVLLNNGELDDGVFDTAVAEGPNYTVPIPGAGLVIEGAPLVENNIRLAADGEITLKTDLTASTGTLSILSRLEDIQTGNQTLTARNLIELIALEDDIRGDGAQYIGTGPSSEILIEAAEEIRLFGTLVDAKKTVTMNADYLYMGAAASSLPTIVNAAPSAIGKVELHAYIIESDAEIYASKDIIIHGDYVDLFNSEIIADGHGLATIDIHGYSFVDVSASDVFARKAINIESYGSTGGGLIAVDSYIEAFGGGSTTVSILSHSFVDVAGSDILATTTVSVEALSGFVDLSFAYLDADFYANGSVNVSASGEFIPDTEEYVIPAETVDEGEVSQSGVFALFSTLIATASVNIESDANVFAPLSYIEATRTQTGSVNISAGIDADLPSSLVQAGKAISIHADDDVTAFDAYFLACGSASSKVEISTGDEIDLSGATIRANLLIDINAANGLELEDASLGISRAGAGDIRLAGSLIEVDNAVFKAPDDLILLGTTVGMSADNTPGTLPCELPEFIPFPEEFFDEFV